MFEFNGYRENVINIFIWVIILLTTQWILVDFSMQIVDFSFIEMINHLFPILLYLCHQVCQNMHLRDWLMMLVTSSCNISFLPIGNSSNLTCANFCLTKVHICRAKLITIYNDIVGIAGYPTRTSNYKIHKHTHGWSGCRYVVEDDDKKALTTLTAFSLRRIQLLWS